jgi:hypothetical protein
LRTLEPVSISSIFARREEDSNYTYSAHIYQNILRYSLVLKRNQQSGNKNLSFTWWEITDWLTSNNNNKNPANKDTKDRIENLQKTIKIKLRNLVDLQLLYLDGNRPIVKGTGTTPTYQFTEFGYLLGWIIESIDSEISQDKICNEIYDLISIIFMVDENSPSSTVFYSKFFKKCNDRQVFGDIVK